MVTQACETCAVAEGRRAFVTKTLLAAVGAWVLQGCGDGDIGGPGAPDFAPPIAGGRLVVSLASFPALATVGGIARVDAGGTAPIAAVRIASETFLAVSMVCTHAGFQPIEIRPTGFRCPNHGAQFDREGAWVGGQPTGDLFQYPVAYDATAGTVTIG
ncbi:Rieske (2Fe-2S) protein [Pseudogemmatithrix spongiicola]|uniref:Rieske (2Fe-2S) protein n=1 Tax=Pseudogemmatithrix spongiicola TaxID=3062599 RepID=A0AA49K1E7_9BACT|nr:Rieske (2Fe-2S) protein [Gemmatimonadaceae bacterium 'strain 138']WKW15924.1 Rieske (2Fe-2S) protein [Gemmatimonadaceae bacterium 'strain 318']